MLTPDQWPPYYEPTTDEWKNGFTWATAQAVSQSSGTSGTAIAGLQTQITANAATFSGFQTQITTNATGVASVRTQATGNGAAITALQGQSTSLQGQITSNGTSIATLATKAAIGSLLRVRSYAAAGVSNHTLLPNTITIRMRVQGAGGGGSGCNIPTTTNISLGAPGTAGAYAEVLLLASTFGSAAVAVTVGTGGPGGVGASGYTGGTSSVGALVSCPGGVAGLLYGTTGAPSQEGNGTQTGVPTAAYNVGVIIAVVGSCDTVSYLITSSPNSGTGAAGGRSMFGSGGNASTANSNGVASLNLGGGGGGTVATSAAAFPPVGGAGAQGIVIIEEFG